MKRIYTALSIAALVLAAGSCEKNLDIPQKSVLSTEDFYTNATAEDAEALIGSVYHLYWGGRDVTCVNGIEKILFLNCLDDDHYPGGGSFSDATNQYQEAGSYNVTSADFAPKIVYKGVYSVMYHCNLILEKIPETNDARINRVKAEANFLRALAMFDAVRWWGTPPLPDHLLSQDEYNQSNNPTEDSIKWILAQMKEAAEQLPAISGKGQQAAFGGRISKHAALAYRDGQYPMDIFKREILIFFTFLVPIACVNYYPVRYIMGYSDSLLYLISPLFCLILFVISIISFNKCLSHYASSGS